MEPVMEIRSATDDDLRSLSELAAPLQARADRHIAYLGTDAETIATEIDDLSRWTAVSAVALSPDDATSPVGWLVGDVDEEMGRVWWHGPFVADSPDLDWAEVASALFDHAADLVPPTVTEAELAIDAAFDELAAWAGGRGFVVDPASAVLTLPLTGRPSAGDTPDDVGADPGPTVAPLAAADHPAVAALHGAAFPGTHTTGAQLVAGDGDGLARLVARLDGVVVGYVAVERSADGEAYVDFVAVAPEHRQRGIGRRLIEAAIARGHAWGCRRVALTVREDNAAARALYRSLGFTEERILVPLRKGFRLP